MHLNGGQRIQEYHQLSAVFPSLSNKIILQLTVSHLFNRNFPLRFWPFPPPNPKKNPRLSTINRATATTPTAEEEIIRSKRRHHHLRVQVEPLDLTKSLDVEPLRKGMHAWLHSEEDSHVTIEKALKECLGMMGNEGSWLSWYWLVWLGFIAYMLILYKYI